MDTAVGAEAWPSGDQVWKGKIAPSTPKPRKIIGKAQYWNSGENVA